MRSSVYAAGLLLAFVSASCSKADTPATDPAPTKSATSPAAGPPLVLAPQGVRFVKAGPGDDAAKLIKAERDAVLSDGRQLIVYVGAKWCEPCQKFHQAAQRGELDAEFPSLTIMEFDLDEDRDRIVLAGYTSKLIPLFVLPGADGRASESRFEGSVKGDKAVANIAPRLRQLLRN